MNTVTQVTILNVDDQDAPRYVKTRDLQQASFAVLEASGGAGGASEEDPTPASQAPRWPWNERRTW
jgi:hypothetical protein